MVNRRARVGALPCIQQQLELRGDTVIAMASLGHVAVGMVAGRLYMGDVRDTRWLAAMMFRFSAVSLLPDADVLGLAFDVPYGAPFGHRGASHSLVFAIAIGIACGVAASLSRPRPPAAKVGLFAAVVAATHGPLDALTDGGLGVAHFWPFSHARHFFSWTPIPVAPIGPGFLSAQGLHVASVELLYFSPLFLVALWPRRKPSPP